MDISVSLLNNRMALQVPGELPLGLVFIVGRVENLGAPVEGAVRFELADAGYRLRCRLPAAVAEETLLKEKDQVRASGHLVFDPHSAQYQLLARDIEVLAAHASGQEKGKIAGAQETSPQDTAQRTAAVQSQATAASLVPTELPPWVRKLAPPEVKEELGMAQEREEPELSSEMEAVEEEGQKAVDQTAQLPPEMVSFLSSAIDSDEEIELAPEMIAEYLPEATRRREVVPAGQAVGDVVEDETAPVTEEGAGAPADEPDEGPADAREEAADGERAGESAPSLSHQAAGAPEKEETETTRPRVLPPPRREVQSQPRPVRHYVEYAVIVVLVLLIIAALLVVVLLLQS